MEAPQPVTPTSEPAPVSSAPKTGTGLEPNVAAALSYLLGPITGVLFFMVEKDKFVRFHAMQSIIAFGGLFLLNLVLDFFLPWGMYYPLSRLVGLGGLVLAVVLIVKAYQKEEYSLPVIGEIAKKQVEK